MVWLLIYPIPEHKTRTVFKSMTTPGAEGEPRGFNELRVEDKKEEKKKKRKEKGSSLLLTFSLLTH